MSKRAIPDLLIMLGAGLALIGVYILLGLAATLIVIGLLLGGYGILADLRWR